MRWRVLKVKVSTIQIWNEEEYQYDVESNFIPTLTSYLHEEHIKRSAVLVIPGGGYGYVSPTEAEVIVDQFYNAGHNAFLLTYTVNPFGTGKPLMYQPLRDISRSVVLIRENGSIWNVKDNQIAVCGFSAGGHLTGSLGVHWDREYLKDIRGIKKFSNKPDALILSYPVITSGEYAHRGSFDNLLGINATDELLEHMSLEKQVSKNTPPTFIWHTVEDGAVPVENTMLFAQALRKAGVSFEMHLFPKGHHGLSTAVAEDERYVNRRNSPVLEQTDKTIMKEFEEMKRTTPDGILFGVPIASVKSLAEFKDMVIKNTPPLQSNLHVSNWVKLCIEWLEIVFVG